MPVADHTDAIIQAIRQKVGSLPGGLASTPEAYPKGWLERAQYPALFIHFLEMSQEETEKQISQTYRFELFYVMENGQEASPHLLARARAGTAMMNLMADRRLGVTGFDLQDSLVTRLASRNPVQDFLEAESQPKTAVQLDFQARVAEAR